MKKEEKRLQEAEKRLEEAEKRLEERVIVNLGALCIFISVEEGSIRRCFINEKREPVHPCQLSSEKFRECWEFIAKYYSLAIAKNSEEEYTDDEIYLGFTLFLGKVKKVLTGIQEHKSIETIMNQSGISRKTWIKFLEYYFS